MRKRQIDLTEFIKVFAIVAAAACGLDFYDPQRDGNGRTDVTRRTVWFLFYVVMTSVHQFRCDARFNAISVI